LKEIDKEIKEDEKINWFLRRKLWYFYIYEKMMMPLDFFSNDNLKKLSI
jgi:hypothetical protein